MDFRTLFSILKKYLSDGADVPIFFRELMEMITNVDEEDWGTSKDPSGKLSDETLRTYSKRGLPKKLAQNIVYHLTPEFLIDRINEREFVVLEKLSRDLEGFDPGISANNVAEKVAEMLVDSIHRAAGLIPQEVLKRQQEQRLTYDLKQKYGEYLLVEEEHACPFPGCGKSLIVSKDGQVRAVYEVGRIEKTGDPEPANLLAMCPSCHATYRLDDSKKKCSTLKAVKSTLYSHQHALHLLDPLPLEKGIVDVVRNIKQLGHESLEEAKLNPDEIRKKINPAEEAVLYRAVKNDVTSYFISVRTIMMNLDKRGEIDYEQLQNQMRALYKKLLTAKKSRLEIFQELSEKIRRMTLQEAIYCQIVVSYFIQSCEVFDAVPE